MPKRILYVNTENLFHTGILRAMVLFPANQMHEKFGHQVGFTSMYRHSEGDVGDDGQAGNVCLGRRSERGISLENVVLHLVFALRVLWFSRSYDVLHCRSYMATAIGLMSKLVFRKRVIFDVRGYIVDEAIESGKLGKGGLGHGILRRLERLLFRRADIIIAVSEAMQNDISARFGRTSIVVRNPAMVGSGQHSIKKDPVVFGYNGSLKDWHLPDLFFAVGKELLLFDPALVVKIVTQDVAKASELAAQYLDASRVQILSCAAEDVAQELSDFSIGWCVIEPTFAKSVCWPVKFNEYLAAGKPVIVNPKIGDLEPLVTQNDLGVVIDVSTAPDVIAAAILTYMQDAKDVSVPAELSDLLAWDAQLLVLDSIYRTT